MKNFAVLIEPWGVYVKDWDLYVEQGGKRMPWGRRWQKIEAMNIESARRKGERLRASSGFSIGPDGQNGGGPKEGENGS